jgi:NAD+ synthase
MQKECIDFIQKTIEKYDYDGCVIGISGGVDSAVVAALCCEAIGKEKVLGLLLPERDSAKNTLNDSVDLCNHLGIPYKVKKISKILRKTGAYALKPPASIVPRKIQEKYVKDKWRDLPKEDTFIEDLEDRGNEEFLKGLAFYRIKHRIRMCLFYLEAEQRNYAVMGTTNKTEMLTGFYVKWGDDSTDIEPIMHLYKTQVYELARELKIPDFIISKPPSPDLIPGITDEFALKVKYKDLDRILMKLQKNRDLDDEKSEDVQRVKQILKAAEKRKIRNLNVLGDD